MGRGLLFQRQLPWRGWLSRQGPQTSPTNAVLAILSDSYPPLKGRLPTCYSPVRHFTGGRSPFLVRLACVRPAANVRSEPGSNSPVNLKSTGIRRHLISYFVCVMRLRAPRLLGPEVSFAIQFSETDLLLRFEGSQYTQQMFCVNCFFRFRLPLEPPRLHGRG